MPDETRHSSADESSEPPSDGEDSVRLPPDDAFAALGNEIRMDALRTLGEADGELTFSELYDRVDVRDSGQFNYHLDKMVGHFVVDTDDGYRLGLPGKRVVEAVLSGAVTDRPDVPPTPVETECPQCGGETEVRWACGGVELFCRSCDGRYPQSYTGDAGEIEDTEDTEDAEGTEETEETVGIDASADADTDAGWTAGGYLGRFPLPPAGTRGRDADEMLRAAWTWGNLELMAVASGLCPRCSGTVEWEANVCDDHDETSVFCSDCGGRYAVGARFECRNCIYASGGEPVIALVAETDLLALLTRNELDPINPAPIHRVEEVHGNYDEEILSRDPLRAAYTFTVGDDSVTITVDESLNRIDASESPSRR